MTSEVKQSDNHHDGAGSRKEMRTAGFGQTVLEPFLVFLRLGLTSFGGPIAHLGYFRQEFVERRKWLSEQTFADLVALCNFLPGPTSSQVCYSIGMTRGGIPDAISARERVYDSVGSHHVVSRLRHPLAERRTGSQLASRLESSRRCRSSSQRYPTSCPQARRHG